MKRKIKIQVGKEEVVGTLFYPNSIRKYKSVIFLYGKNGLKEKYYTSAEILLKKGYSSICFDHRGRGESKANHAPTIHDRVKDVVAVLKFFSTQSCVDSKNITLISTSMGSYVAASICNMSKGIVKLVLVAPMIYGRKFEKKPYTSETQKAIKELKTGNKLQNSRPIKEIRKYKRDIVVATITGDKIIPSFISNSYYDNALNARSREKLEIKFKTHGILAYKEGQRTFAKFLQNIL